MDRIGIGTLTQEWEVACKEDKDQDEAIQPKNNLRPRPISTPGANYRHFGKEADTRKRRKEGRAYGTSCYDQEDDHEDYSHEGIDI